MNFAIVASGPNAASPHHHASDRVIGPGEVVLCDFGGTTAEPHGEPGYCSDITRCVHTGPVPAEFPRPTTPSRRPSPRRCRPPSLGTPAEAVDKVARDGLAQSGLAE